MPKLKKNPVEVLLMQYPKYKDVPDLQRLDLKGELEEGFIVMAGPPYNLNSQVVRRKAGDVIKVYLGNDAQTRGRMLEELDWHAIAKEVSPLSKKGTPKPGSALAKKAASMGELRQWFESVYLETKPAAQKIYEAIGTAEGGAAQQEALMESLLDGWERLGRDMNMTDGDRKKELRAFLDDYLDPGKTTDMRTRMVEKQRWDTVATKYKPELDEYQRRNGNGRNVFGGNGWGRY
jgi:hypothetical protein